MAESKKIEGLKSELKETKEELDKTSREKNALTKAIWDILNYSEIFVILLDSKMNIVLINYKLATKLGFKDEKEAIGRCWLDFIKPDEHAQMTAIHYTLTHKKDIERYREVVNDIVKLDGNVCTIKWFNFAVNHESKLTFSLGIPKKFPVEITEESLRSYYRDVLKKDKTMIKSLRDIVIKGIEIPDFCDTDLGGRY